MWTGRIHVVVVHDHDILLGKAGSKIVNKDGLHCIFVPWYRDCKAGDHPIDLLTNCKAKGLKGKLDWFGSYRHAGLKNGTGMATLTSASGPQFNIENWHIIVHIRVCEYLKVPWPQPSVLSYSRLGLRQILMSYYSQLHGISDTVQLGVIRHDTVWHTVAVPNGARYVVDMLTMVWCSARYLYTFLLVDCAFRMLFSPSEAFNVIPVIFRFWELPRNERWREL